MVAGHPPILNSPDASGDGHDAGGALVRRAGIMAVVVAGGDVCPSDAIGVDLPDPPHRRLEPV